MSKINSWIAREAVHFARGSTVSEYGLVVEETAKSGVRVAYDYDALGRRTGATDPRTGRASIHYDAQGRVEYQEDAAGNRTSFGYDPVTGRKAWEKNALGKYTRYRANDRGEVTHVWGDATYPIRYEYDGYGQRTRMDTYQGGTGWTSEAWPAETGTGDVTIWHFDEATGLLTAKEDAAGKKVSYTYTPANQLHTRTWARTESGSPLVTTYVYDPNTAELTDIDYSGSATDVSFDYDRLGRQQAITDAVGSRIFGYTDALQLETETITGLYNTTITRNHAITAPIGRDKGFSVGSGYTAIYGYDPATGRFATVSWNAGGAAGSAAYSYVPDSDLLQGLAFSTGQHTTYGYEPNRDLKTRVKNQFNTNLISQYEYSYDPVGRRENVKNSGAAFTASGFNLYGYNDRSELTASSRYLGAEVTDTTQPVENEKRGYVYDNIGNRKQATAWNAVNSLRLQLTYTANQLNQYNLITEDNGRLPEAPTYDADGNMTGYGAKHYLYDGENRLVAVEPETPADGSKRLEFVYDYQGRRVQKRVYSYDAVAADWSPPNAHSYVYDGWNMVQELDGNGQASASYVWGLDLSQSLQGAGGIGGLLARVDVGTNTYTYDGNGNVGQLLDPAGTMAAQYEYDPYGNEVKAIGPLANANPYCFSTKYLDTEAGMYYYGFRYYLPEMGRWPSRDPIEEQGGLNLYGMVRNNSINKFDSLGLIDLFIKGQTHTQINGFNDALSHYRSGAGGVLPAGSGLYAEMRADSSYQNRVAGNDSWIAKQIKDKLNLVPKNQTSGTFSNAPGSFVGDLHSLTLGSYGLNIQYTLTWNAGSWQKRWYHKLTGDCFRLVSTNASISYSNITDWNFQSNPQYNWYQDLTKETIPGKIAGAIGTPAPFDISLILVETYNLTVEQSK